MKKSLLLIFLVIGLTLHFTSCRKEINNSQTSRGEATLMTTAVKIPGAEVNEDAYNTFYGPVVQMGNGHARSWVNISRDNRALALGVEMTEGAFQNLPDIPEDERDFISGPADFLLPLHQKAKELTPYDHICINWNAHGHEPAGLYDIPHFDFHFYRMTLGEQMTIPPYNLAPTLFDNDPPAGYMPDLYFHASGGVPEMGAHWIDLLTPELYGQPFTYTFIYGSYNGHVTFNEPMITMATIQGGNTIHKDIRQPLHFSPTNKYYPTRYSIWKDDSNNKHYISLDEMVLR